MCAFADVAHPESFDRVVIIFEFNFTSRFIPTEMLARYRSDLVHKIQTTVRVETQHRPPQQAIFQ